MTCKPDCPECRLIWEADEPFVIETDFVGGTCRPDCINCRIEAFNPPIEDDPLILEHLVVGMGLGLSFWASGWLIYAIGSLIERHQGGTFALVVMMTAGGLVAGASRIYGRR